MCKVGLYFVAFASGVVVALTIDVLALPSVAGVAVEVRPAQERGAVNQTVDRRHKTDRLTPSNERKVSKICLAEPRTANISVSAA